MHETPQDHPQHVYETTPRTRKKHTLQGNRRNGKGEHTEPSPPTRILKMTLKGTPARAPHHPHQHPHPQGHPDHQATSRHSHPCQPAEERRCHPKGYTPRAHSEHQRARGGNSFGVVKLFHGGETFPAEEDGILLGWRKNDYTGSV